jgi:hypothetical protein
MPIKLIKAGHQITSIGWEDFESKYCQGNEFSKFIFIYRINHLQLITMFKVWLQQIFVEHVAKILLEIWLCHKLITLYHQLCCSFNDTDHLTFRCQTIKLKSKKPHELWVGPLFKGLSARMNHRQSTHRSTFDNPVELHWRPCGDKVIGNDRG